MSHSTSLRRHRAWRLLGLLVGVLLLYAPFAVLVRLLVWASDSPLLADGHRICLRMPIQWLFQPWMYPTMLREPGYLVAILVLPLLALLLGPWFCGWLCPPGLFTEFLSRLVPRRLQLDFAGKINPNPVRYGVLVGLVVAPFFGANVCCSFCNFAWMQNLISAVFGQTMGLRHSASFLLVTLFLWLLVGGLFTVGGRGWCAFLCPAGAIQGLAHHLGAKLGFSRAVHIDPERCIGCGQCVKNCPTWALRLQHKQAQVNDHGCNVCLDCTQVCPEQAIAYRRRQLSSQPGRSEVETSPT